MEMKTKYGTMVTQVLSLTDGCFPWFTDEGREIGWKIFRMVKLELFHQIGANTVCLTIHMIIIQTYVYFLTY